MPPVAQHMTSRRKCADHAVDLWEPGIGDDGNRSGRGLDFSHSCTVPISLYLRLLVHAASLDGPFFDCLSCACAPAATRSSFSVEVGLAELAVSSASRSEITSA